MRAILILLLALGATPAWATWAVVITDEATGEVAIGQATCVSGIDLRSLSAVVVTEYGVATVQAQVDSSGVARSTVRDELLAGTSPIEILTVLGAADPQHETHQYCIVDTLGRAATYTGTSAQGNQFAGGQTGSVGNLHYCVAGNLLTGEPVVSEAVQAIVDTEGSLADKLLAAMQAARSMGGDGRCSCSPSNPTGCGSPPPAFDRSAINGYLVLARTGDTAACAQCAGGDYYLDLNIAFQGSGGSDPVLLLQSQYGVFLDDLKKRPDAVESSVGFDPPALLPDGSSTSTMGVVLLDLNGAPIGVPIQSFIVEHAPESETVGTIGVPVDNGGGSYSVPITAGITVGVDRYRVTVDDGQRPAILMPAPRLGIGVPREVENLRWTNKITLEWESTPESASYHVYRGELSAISCEFFGDCRNDLDPDRTDLVLVDLSEPPPGDGSFYLITAVDIGGNEGPIGNSDCGPRPNANPCP